MSIPTTVLLRYHFKPITMNTLAKLENDFTNNIMGYSALGIVLSTCLGSVAIMQILSYGNSFGNMALVLLCVAICSIHNAAILTVQPPKLIFKLLGLSVVINSMVIVGSILI